MAFGGTCCAGTEPGPQARAEDGEGRARQQAGGERSGKQIVTKPTTTFEVLFARKLRSPSRVVFCQRLSHTRYFYTAKKYEFSS
jgi:hypothetical protein